MKNNAVTRGFIAGLIGVATMTAAEKLEQMLNGRPNSFVPAHTLERLLGLPRRPDQERLWLNWTMHWGQGIVLGAVRGLMAACGLRGPVGSFLFLNLRLLNDQALENATGVGSPAIYAFVTGAVADQLIAGPPRISVHRKGWTAAEKQSSSTSYEPLPGL
jgi:hypothetical protein